MLVDLRIQQMECKTCKYVYGIPPQTEHFTTANKPKDKSLKCKQMVRKP